MEKRIFRYEFNEILRNIMEISPQERDFLNKCFANDLIDGLTEFELKQKIDHLKFDQNDCMNSFDAEKVKAKMLEAMSK